MSKEIKIGADELILWLRKNKIAKKSDNDKIQGLGRKIHDLIVKLGGEKIVSNHQSHWANLTSDKNIKKDNLPKTSAQYKIDSSKMGELYEQLSSW